MPMSRRSRRNESRPTRPNYIIIGLIVLALALLGIACFFIFYNNKRKTAASESSCNGKTFECSHIKKVEKSDIGSESDMNRMIQDLKKFILLIEPPSDDSLITSKESAITNWFKPLFKRQLKSAMSSPGVVEGGEVEEQLDESAREVIKLVEEIKNEAKANRNFNFDSTEIQDKLTRGGDLLNRIFCIETISKLEKAKMIPAPRFLDKAQLHQAYFLECAIEYLYNEYKKFRVILIHSDLTKPIHSDFLNNINLIDAYLDKLPNSDCTLVFTSTRVENIEEKDKQKFSLYPVLLKNCLEKWTKSNKKILSIHYIPYRWYD